MVFDPQQRRDALHAFMERTGLKPSPWESAAKLGEGTLRKFLNGTTDTLTDRTYTQLAEGAKKLLGQPVSVQDMQEILRDANLSTESSEILEGRQKIITAPPLARADHETDKTRRQVIRILGTTLAGSEGDFQVTNGETLDTVPRPAHLNDREGILGVWVEGESMVPWRRPGQLVVLDSLRRPRNGDHVVIEIKAVPPDEDRPAYLKLLVRQTPTKLVVAQYKPAREFSIDRKRIHRIYRVMEQDELLGLR